ncbi:DMT family transporter [Actinophytocola sp.]|uniref:DMT family transporter n=1 Tax=Actinophytocola sp. TaxID=1872138 RepID=UPI002ED329CB
MSVDDSAIAVRRVVVLAPGVVWGSLGVLAFSLTLPASEAALPAFGPVTVGIGRAVPAALLGAVCLLVARAPRPTGAQWRRLAFVATGVVVGFPLCSSLALRDTTSAHGAVLVGLLPATTAALAVVRGGERPRWQFWAACAFGMATVLGFTAIQGAGHITAADLWLLAAVGCAAVGYTEGGVLARELGGWQVISWALLLSLPFTIAVTVLWAEPWHAPDANAWLGLAYVSAISMFAGFYAWYRGLAEGGIAKIAQLQLLQPVLTLAWSALLLGNQITWATAAAALLVITAVAVTQRTRS